MSYFRALLVCCVLAVVSARPSLVGVETDVNAPPAPPPTPSGPCDPCTPILNAATSVQAVNGLRGSAEIVPDYGTCPVTYRGYRWYVSWGDGVSSYQDSSALEPEQALYTYQSPGTYNVTVGYCAHLFYCCDGCTYKSTIIDVNS